MKVIRQLLPAASWGTFSSVETSLCPFLEQLKNSVVLNFTQRRRDLLTECSHVLSSLTGWIQPRTPGVNLDIRAHLVNDFLFRVTFLHTESLLFCHIWRWFFPISLGSRRGSRLSRNTFLSCPPTLHLTGIPWKAAVLFSPFPSATSLSVNPWETSARSGLFEASQRLSD